MKLTDMRISNPETSRVANEGEILDELLQLKDAKVLELGCGKAEKTRLVARKAASVLALEVDAAQLAKNLAVTDLPNVAFAHGGAEKIPADDSKYDIVLMFKSLHHVPVALMDNAFAEIRRVLKPGGVAYISEPVFTGDFNEIVRLFHDERAVRDAAFEAERRALATGRFSLESQKFFLQPVHYESFAQFEEQVIKVTHTERKLSDAIFEQVRSKFNRHMTANGVDFHTTIRVDLLRKS